MQVLRVSNTKIIEDTDFGEFYYVVDYRVLYDDGCVEEYREVYSDMEQANKRVKKLEEDMICL